MSVLATRQTLKHTSTP
jgi:hypothetical protein